MVGFAVSHRLLMQPSRVVLIILLRCRLWVPVPRPVVPVICPGIPILSAASPIPPEWRISALEAWLLKLAMGCNLGCGAVWGVGMVSGTGVMGRMLVLGVPCRVG